MKKILLLLAIPFFAFSQERMIGELQISLINHGSTWNITFTLTAIGAR